MAERRPRPWHLYLLAVVGVVLAVLAVTDIGPPSSSARTSTQAVTAEKAVVQSTVTGTGNIEPGSDLNVNFQTAGTLSAVYVHVGQHVNKGQLLATLNSTSAQLTLDQAGQSLTAAEDQLSSAESGSSTSTGSSTGGSSATSSAGATNGGSTTASSTTTSAASIASAQAAVDSAQANVDTAQAALNNTKLYAPNSGTIVSLASVSPGNTVSAGTTGNASASGTSSSSGTSASSGSPTSGSSGATAGSLGSTTSSSSSSSSGSSSSPFAEIINTRTMTMTVAFSESDVNKLKVGKAATVTPDALSGVELGAHVTSISPVGTTSSNVVSYQSTLTLDQNDSSVKPGMSASAAVIVGQAQGVNVPNAAVTGTGSLATVTVLRNGKQAQQQVVVGLRGDSRTQIISGLSAGEQVVIKTTLPPLGSATTSTTSPSGTLGGTGARQGGFGGAAGGGVGGAGGGGGAGRAPAAGAAG